MARQLSEIREEIDSIDGQMAQLYEKRLDLAKAVAEYKYENNLEIFDASREKAVIEKNLKYIQNEDYREAYAIFINHLMEQSKALQQQLIESKKQQNDEQ